MFSDRLEQGLALAVRTGRSVAVVLCDVDRFKHVNATYGHQAGDCVLQAFAKLLMGSTRKDIDWVVPYGGEEFLIVMRETPTGAAVAFAEKMRVTIAAHAFKVTEGTLSVRSSFGVAGYHSVQAPEEVSVDSLPRRSSI